MFCSSCGNQLPDDAKFCGKCGYRIGDLQVPEASAPTAVLPQEPVFQEPQPVPVPEEFPQQPPQPPVAKKKKKKTGLVIGLILVLVLALGLGGAGIYLYIQNQNQQAYDAAVALLESRDYDGALKAFGDLGSFQDAAQQASDLQDLQARYDSALGLMNEHKYADAASAFKKLKDYRDSREYAEHKVDYEKALYLMEGAAAGDLSAMEVVEGYHSDSAMPDTEGFAAFLLYQEAASVFEDLNGYADSADRASSCWLNVALIELGWEDYDSAMERLGQLSEADAGALNQAYEEICADASCLADIPEAFAAWYDDALAYDYGEEIQMARDMVMPYFDKHFRDTGLQSLLYEFLDALDLMELAVGSNGEVSDWITYYEGMAELYAVADAMQESHMVFSGNSEYMDWFVGKSDKAARYPAIEADLQDWWLYDAVASPGEDGHYYASYTNTSGYAFTLYATIYFYDANENLIETSEVIEIYVAQGATIQIPTIPQTVNDDGWYTWDMAWQFEVD